MTSGRRRGADRNKVPTRERLKREALRLFAANGFEGTTVGQIEAAAGLKPRRGALYRHFKSKETLLQVAVEEAATEDRRREFDALAAPPGDVLAVARTTGRLVLADFDAIRAITQIIEREGDRLPAVRDTFRAGSDAGYRTAAAILARWAQTTGARIDAEATAALLVGGLVNHRRTQWTLGAPAIGLDDERVLDAYAALAAALLDG